LHIISGFGYEKFELKQLYELIDITKMAYYSVTFAGKVDEIYKSAFVIGERIIKPVKITLHAQPFQLILTSEYI
jgi:hypothetical protein